MTEKTLLNTIVGGPQLPLRIDQPPIINNASKEENIEAMRGYINTLNVSSASTSAALRTFSF